MVGHGHGYSILKNQVQFFCLVTGTTDGLPLCRHDVLRHAVWPQAGGLGSRATSLGAVGEIVGSLRFDGPFE